MRKLGLLLWILLALGIVSAAMAGDGIDRFFLKVGPTVNFTKFRLSDVRWPPGIIRSETSYSGNHTTIGGQLDIGTTFAINGFPLRLGLSYQYLGKLQRADKYLVIANHDIWYKSEGNQKDEAQLHNFSLAAKFNLFNENNRFKPFISARVGKALYNVSTESDWAFSFRAPPVEHTWMRTSWSDRKWAFSYGIGAGFDFALNGSTSLSAEYEYLGTTKIKIKETGFKMNAVGHILKTALTISF